MTLTLAAVGTILISLNPAAHKANGMLLPAKCIIIARDDPGTPVRRHSPTGVNAKLWFSSSVNTPTLASRRVSRLSHGA